MKLIVTAGGQGKKIWPLSREAKPKQFQAIVGQITLYQQTIKSLLKSFKAEDIYVSTKKRYYKMAKLQSPEIPKENYVLEPDIAKDRGPGEGLAFLTLAMRHPDEPFMIVQADCLREPESAFLNTLQEAEKIEIKDRKFMSGGIKATYPILGIDYLRLGKRISSKSGIEIYQTEDFVERSEDYAQTKKLIKNFHIATHSNHSCWYPELILEAYKKYRPDWYKSLMKIKDIWTKKGSDKQVDKIYSQMESGATELVTKHLFKDGYTILLPYKWTDIGTWDSVYEFFDPGDNKVHVDGQALVLDSQSSFIKSENEKKMIAVCGIDNLIIIDTKDALLVCSKDHAGDVKKIVDTLKEKKLDQYI